MNYQKFKEPIQLTEDVKAMGYAYIDQMFSPLIRVHLSKDGATKNAKMNLEKKKFIECEYLNDQNPDAVFLLWKVVSEDFSKKKKRKENQEEKRMKIERKNKQERLNVPSFSSEKNVGQGYQTFRTNKD